MQRKRTSAIHQAFEDLTKDQLTRLRRMADYPIRSTLNKADLVDALEDNFTKDPVRLLNQLPIYDIELLSELCKIPSGSCLVSEIFPDMLYIQEFNICEWDYSKEGTTEEFWLTDDMRLLISPFIDQIADDINRSGRVVIDFLFWGMLWIYGFPEIDDFIKLIKREFGDSEEDWMPIYDNLVRYFPYTDYMKNDGMVVHPMIVEMEYCFAERRMRGFDRKPLRDYTFKEIMAVGAAGPFFLFGIEGREYRNALEALKKCGYDEYQSTARLSRLWRDVLETEGPERPTEIFKRVIGVPNLKSVEEFQAVGDAIFAYMNELPRWSLGGRKPTDIKMTSAEKNQLASFQAAIGKVKETMASPYRAGRNDPCPCGSGLKYKNCHGKNIS